MHSELRPTREVNAPNRNAMQLVMLVIEIEGPACERPNLKRSFTDR